MSDEVTTDTTAAPATAPTTTTTEPATAPARGRVTFSAEQQAEVDRIVQDRIARVKKEPAPKPTNGNGHVSADEVQRMLVRDRALTRAATTAGLTDKQTERMEAAMRADNPDDPAAWSRDYLADMGLNTKPTPTPSVTPAEPAKPPAAAPSAPSGPAQPGTVGGIVDLFNLSHEQLVALGPEGTRAAFEQITSMGRRQQGALPPPRNMAQKK